MRTVPDCPACGSAEATVVARLDADRMGRFVAFSQRKYGGLLERWLDEVPPVVRRCALCGHCWYVHQPEPEQLATMYASGRPLTGGVTASREPTPTMVATMSRLRRLVGESTAAATLLDYGSGFGRWARAGARAGFTVTAFEPSAERGAEPSAGPERPFALVHDADGLRGRHFDAVQLEQVLEHVPDPLATLHAIRAHCGADSVLRITVPNLLRTPEGRNIWALWPFDGTSPHVMAPFEHLHGFTPRSLDRLLQRAGFVSLGGGRLWRHQPGLQVRRIVGRVLPAVGATLRFVVPAQARPAS